MQDRNPHTPSSFDGSPDGAPGGSPELSDFMVSLAALAEDIRESDLIVSEVQGLAASLSEQVALLEVQRTELTSSSAPVVAPLLRSAIARVAAVAAALTVGVGGLGVAGALPGPIQQAFDQAVQAVEQAADSFVSVATDPEGSMSGNAGEEPASAEVPDIVSSYGDDSSVIDVLDMDADSDGTPDEQKSSTAVSVASVISNYDRAQAVSTLGSQVSAVASQGKAGGSASMNAPGQSDERRSTQVVRGREVATQAPGPAEDAELETD